MAFHETSIDVIVTQKKKIIERATVEVSVRQSAKIRALFWEALRTPPSGRLTPTRDLVFEQEWLGRARSYEVIVQGPLTSKEYLAYDYVNAILPDRYRFLVDFGGRRQRRR
jgi:hypothetical protein